MEHLHSCTVESTSPPPNPKVGKHGRPHGVADLTVTIVVSREPTKGECSIVRHD